MSAKEEYNGYIGYRKEIAELKLYLDEIKHGNLISITQNNDNLGGSKSGVSDPTYIHASHNERETKKTLQKIETIEKKLSLLDEAIENLKKPEQRTAMRMHYVRGKSYTTISCFMGIDRHTLFSLLQNGLKETQEFLNNANYWGE